jgi:adenylate cyclase
MTPRASSPVDDLTQSERTVLVADVVEYTRLMQVDESGTVRRWQAFVDELVEHLLPRTGGRLLKSLGDGLMLDFTEVQQAPVCALAMQAAMAERNRAVPHDLQLWLRIGVHVGPVIAGRHDVYGHGLNLAARLMTLAGPGEIVVSADVRDHLTPELDADLEDLGECYVKHIRQPVRVFRVGPPGSAPLIDQTDLADDLRSTIAVIPFTSREPGPDHAILGQVIADEVISALSRSLEINVVSRLSTSSLQGRDLSLEAIRGCLNVDYVISGSFRVEGDRLNLRAELADVRSGQVAWAGSLRGGVKAAMAGDDALSSRLVSDACTALMVREMQRAQGQAPQTLENRTLMLASIALMHRISLQAFQRAHQMLSTLTDRAPRFAAPHAWLAKWHVLRVTQGWSTDPRADGMAALDCTKRALDRDADSSLAMTIDGQVHTHILKRLDVAEQQYARALQSNPSDALAWLLKGTLHAFRDEPREAVRHTRRALRLSPLDPLRYYFDAHAAGAAVAAEDYRRAEVLARHSLRLNRTHGSTLRILVAALWYLDRPEEARAAAKELMRLEPAFSVSGFLGRSPSAGFENGKRVARALGEAGVPL